MELEHVSKRCGDIQVIENVSVAVPVLFLWFFLELFRKLRRGNEFLALVLFLCADRVLIRIPFQNYTGIIELAIAAVFFWRIAWLADHCYEPA
ncbi:hypothetical protein K420107F6_29920 [Lactonifactor longoviformis]